LISVYVDLELYEYNPIVNQSGYFSYLMRAAMTVAMPRPRSQRADASGAATPEMSPLRHFLMTVMRAQHRCFAKSRKNGHCRTIVLRTGLSIGPTWDAVSPFRDLCTGPGIRSGKMPTP
jgi:hypothetical protein